jgi:hypothetical protein
MKARDITMGTVLDAVGWAREAYRAARDTPPGSSERRKKIEELSLAVMVARQKAQEYEGRLAPELRIALLVAEQGLRRMRGEATGASGRHG